MAMEGTIKETRRKVGWSGGRPKSYPQSRYLIKFTCILQSRQFLSTFEVLSATDSVIGSHPQSAITSGGLDEPLETLRRGP